MSKNASKPVFRDRLFSPFQTGSLFWLDSVIIEQQGRPSFVMKSLHPAQQKPALLQHKPTPTSTLGVPGCIWLPLQQAFRLLVKGRNKAEPVSCRLQLILINTIHRCESSTPSQFTFLLKHTGKLEALLLPSDPIPAPNSLPSQGVGKHVGVHI